MLTSLLLISTLYGIQKITFTEYVNSYCTDIVSHVHMDNRVGLFGTIFPFSFCFCSLVSVLIVRVLAYSLQCLNNRL